MKSNKKPAESTAAPWRVVRVFEGTRSAEQVAADLVKVHSAA